MIVRVGQAYSPVAQGRPRVVGNTSASTMMPPVVQLNSSR